MKVTGVIAEYNPFHNGHKYQLTELKERTGADYLVVAMSGDFLQRGVPAVLDKYTRTRMALLSGADLVLEIPSVWACSSAEYFASAGVRLLASTGVVDTLGYGVETEQPALFAQVSSLLTHTPNEYNKKVLSLQKEGLSFPAARAAALEALLGKLPAAGYPDTGSSAIAPSDNAVPSTTFSTEDLSSFLASPNNILAIEYEKALASLRADSLQGNTAMVPTGFPIRRVGDGYHDSEAHSDFASATAIRNMLFRSDGVSAYVPDSTYAIVTEKQREGSLIEEDAFSLLLYYRLLLLKEEGYEQFADCSHDLSCKIANHLYEFRNFRQFAMLLKSKDVTYTRICRVLVHILLGITKEDYATWQGADMIPYLRILGFRKDATPLLSGIKKEASVPLLSKVADASHILSENAYALLQKDIFAADLYSRVAADRSHTVTKNEFTQGLVMI